ncbi:MAG: ARMT1-like domain-containing protein, partial [Candidatus Thorarchaeota archaeon]
NDATREDIQGTEIEKLASIADSGAWAHGVPLEYVSKEFLDLFRESDLVISKGQANIETVPAIQEMTGVETYYITKAKCSHISQAIGAKKGSNVVLRRPSV